MPKLNLRKAIDAERELFASPEFSDQQAILARGGRISAEDLPIRLQDEMGLKPTDKIRLSEIGFKNFLNDRDSGDPSSWMQRGRDAEDTTAIAESNYYGRRGGGYGRGKFLGTPMGYLDNSMVDVSRVDQSKKVPPQFDSVSKVSDRGGNIIENPGELGDEGIKTLVNQFNNFLRLKSRVAAKSTPLGAIGTAVTDIAEDLGNENPLQRFLSDASKFARRKVSDIAGIRKQTLEDQLLDYLGNKIPVVPYPEAKGLRRYAGIGQVKPPFGQFSIDESGALRKL